MLEVYARSLGDVSTTINEDSGSIQRLGSRTYRSVPRVKSPRITLSAKRQVLRQALIIRDDKVGGQEQPRQKALKRTP